MENLNHIFKQLSLSKRWNRRKWSLSDTHAPNEFRSLINRERARSDRTGVLFSIVVFHNNGDKTTALHLIAVVKKRIRFIDEVGWLDAHNVGVILPQASFESARKLATHICRDATFKNPPLRFEVYTYPSEGVVASDRNPPADPPNTRDTQRETPPKPENREMGIKQFERLHPFFAPKLPLWKRGLDLFGATLGCIILFPLFLFIAVTIKAFSSGPVFFKQERVGHLGKSFYCWKFRTMSTDADFTAHQSHVNDLIDSEKPMAKLDDTGDPRVIPFGRFLRQTGLDELPQLFSVFLGDMSLVGPRPCLFYEAERYRLWQTERFDTLPGLTGLWQVSGKNKTTFKEMLRLDISYTKKKSFWLDLSIILKTPKVIINQAMKMLFNKNEQEYA